MKGRKYNDTMLSQIVLFRQISCYCLFVLTFEPKMFLHLFLFKNNCQYFTSEMESCTVILVNRSCWIISCDCWVSHFLACEKLLFQTIFSRIFVQQKGLEDRDCRCLGGRGQIYFLTSIIKTISPSRQRFASSPLIKEGGFLDFPGDTVVKNPPANAGDMGLSPRPGRSHTPRSS